MGRRRLHDDPLKPLPRGLYAHRRRFRTRGVDRKWIYFEPPYEDACVAYRAWLNDHQRGTIAWLLDYFATIVAPAKVRAQQLAERTARDYKRDREVLQGALGHIPIAALTPKHVSEFRNARAPEAPSHVRNELACLSAAMSYAVEAGHAPRNPCRDVRRPSRRRRMRLVSDAEYLEVYQRAEPSVRIAMTLALRTLALPGDVLAMGPRNLVTADGRRILRFARGKTGVPVEIEVIGELAQVIDAHLAQTVVRQTFVHTEKGAAYTVDGIGAMFRRYCAKAAISDFGLRDLRAKGATDEYRSGRSLRELQHLLGHRSVRTTEIYIKSLVPEVVRPNLRPVLAEAK